MSSKIKKPAVGNEDTKTWLTLGIIIGVSVFCLISAKTLLGKAMYQQKVISKNHKTLKVLNSDIDSSSKLISTYKGLFENNAPANVLGAKNDTSSTAVPPNVSNSRLAIDALPTTYDYPALIASLTKILSDAGISSPTVTGTDLSTSTSSDPQPNPQPVTISLSITGTGTYSSVQNVLTALERSIRPIDVTTLELSGSESKLNFTATLNSYFQPAKTLGLTQEKVK